MAAPPEPADHGLRLRDRTPRRVRTGRRATGLVRDPGFYQPVQIGGRRYVDGGVASTSNLDVLAGEGLDLVICLNPTSSLHAPQPRTLGERAARVLRETSGRRLGSEATRVWASGTEVIVIQPTGSRCDGHELDDRQTTRWSSRRRRDSSREKRGTTWKIAGVPTLGG